MGNGEKDLNRALETLQAEVPDSLCRAIRWLRDPKARWVRIPAGLTFILAGSCGSCRCSGSNGS